MSDTKRAVCPSCHERSRFQAAGKQHWPHAVAAKHGLPPVINLWTCSNCNTTVSEPELEAEEQVKFVAICAN